MDRTGLDEIDMAAEQLLQCLLEDEILAAEVDVRLVRQELDEKIEITSVAVEVISGSAAEQDERLHEVTFASLSQLRVMFGDDVRQLRHSERLYPSLRDETDCRPRQ